MRLMTGVRIGPVRCVGMIARVALVAAMAASAQPAAAESPREACTNDAFRLCSDTIPDVERTKACLARNRANLSAPCKTAFASDRSYGRRVRHHR